jgi:hypothetical protein
MGDFTKGLGKRTRRASQIPEGEFPPFEFALDETITDEQRERYRCDEVWVSGRYTVFVRRNEPTGWSAECDCVEEEGPDGGAHPNCDLCEGSGRKPMAVTHLSIKRNDRGPIHDWRDFQIIKNTFCGDDAEGIEIYPAESRLVDTSNQYHLWVFAPGEHLPLGFNDGRLVTQATFGQAQQRPFEVPPEDAPSEEEFFGMALRYCESKGICGQDAVDVLGREPTGQEIRAVYDRMKDDALREIVAALADRVRPSLVGVHPPREVASFCHERGAIITGILSDRGIVLDEHVAAVLRLWRVYQDQGTDTNV